jgi:hypothetical protein
MPSPSIANYTIDSSDGSWPWTEPRITVLRDYLNVAALERNAGFDERRARARDHVARLDVTREERGGRRLLGKDKARVKHV